MPETLEDFIRRWGQDFSIRVVNESPLEVVVSPDMPGDGQTANFRIDGNTVQCVAITLAPGEA
ncbi:hypothetical protein IQ265_00720 [Nodosilinea sp. LEGE 06152]|uniref:hypothetical protein n=1 Tax=Nodosilinea sp. LEGE 06152 TaxID=2777966 RepID=UPI001881692D|nr:hypothetical protein [Nodosilinea sp. LEGE 06152]MBE9155370.1 hypothetical protein [Nodosilinea sp. LEGE 06152]